MIKTGDITIEIHGLDNSFGDGQVLQGVELSAPQRPILGFLEPKGGGKTLQKKAVLNLNQQTTDRGLKIFIACPAWHSSSWCYSSSKKQDSRSGS